MTNVERARALSATLSQVRTNAEGRRVAAATVLAGQGAIDKLGGFSSAGVRDLIARDVQRVQAAADMLPDDGNTVDDAWARRPSGVRPAIESLSADVWAQESVFPAGTSGADDWSTFADGFVDGLRGELDGALAIVPAVSSALAPLIWPLAAVAVAILTIVVIAKTKAGA